MNKSVIIFIICIFLILPIFSLSKPVEVQTIASDKSLKIAYPLVEYGMPNTQFYPHFHIFNSSNGYQFREGDNINCSLDIYAPNGDEIFDGWNNTFIHTFDILISIPSSLFDSYGTYSYVVYCENPIENIGGAVNSPIEITPSGKETVNNFFPTILVFLILGAVYFFFGDLNQKAIAMDSTKVSTWVTILCYAMIIIKAITLSYFSYAIYMNIDINTLLSFVWFSDLFILSGICLFTMLFAMLGYFNPSLKDNKWEPKKW